MLAHSNTAWPVALAAANRSLAAAWTAGCTTYAGATGPVGLAVQFPVPPWPKVIALLVKERVLRLAVFADSTGHGMHRNQSGSAGRRPFPDSPPDTIHSKA